MSGRHVVMMSSGAGSWAAAKRVVERHGTEGVTLLFADVKGDAESEHAGEDQDNYRFLEEAAANVGVPYVRITEAKARDIWRVFEDENMLGNNRAPICSMRLKQEPARLWVEANCDPAATTIYLGLDWDEAHRHEPNRRGWAPWPVEYPMAAEPWLDREQVLDWLRAEGIEPPRLYDMGYQHANCGGFCVQMGQADAVHLLRTNPERYAYHEQREQQFRQDRDVDAAFMADRRHAAVLERLGLTAADVARRPKPDAPGKTEWYVVATGERLPGRVPLTMRDLRLRVEAEPSLFDKGDRGPCACFPFASARPDRSAGPR
jgi:hypothetical protein